MKINDLVQNYIKLEINFFDKIFEQSARNIFSPIQAVWIQYKNFHFIWYYWFVIVDFIRQEILVRDINWLNGFENSRRLRPKLAWGEQKKFAQRNLEGNDIWFKHIWRN